MKNNTKKSKGLIDTLFDSLGGVAGGAICELAGSAVSLSDDTAKNNYYKAGIFLVGGAALKAFMKTPLLQGVGAGCTGVAGYLAAQQLLGTSTSTTTTSGVGLLPTQMSIGDVDNWIDERSADEDENPLPKGQKNVM